MKNERRCVSIFLALVLAAGVFAGCGPAVPTGAGLPQATTAPADSGIQQATPAPTEAPDWPVIGQYPAQETAFPSDFTAELDAILARHPGKASAWLQDLTTGETYSYNGETSYYCASLLKAPYALWLSRRADEGEVDLDRDLPNLYQGKLADGPLADYDQSETVPARAALYAMLCYSNNQAAMLLADVWPADWWHGFSSFLKKDLGCPDADGCAVTRKGGLDGTLSVRDMAAILRAISQYFDKGTENARRMQQAMLDCPHDGLYFSPETPVAKKYGSWTNAVHDAGIVYAPRPYLIIFMSDTGDKDISFPEPAYTLMQEFGRAALAHIDPDLV